MTNEFETVNAELQLLAELNSESIVEDLWLDMQVELDNVNALLQRIADESREDEVMLRWEDMVIEMYMNIYPEDEDFLYDECF